SSTTIPITSVDGIVWRGSFTVVAGTNGSGQFSWIGRDLAGNTGTQITQNGSFFVDTIPPSASIALSPLPPYKPGTINITVTASEALQATSVSAFFPKRSGGVLVPLSGSGTSWAGQLEIFPTDGVGTANLGWLGTDLAGNQGAALTGLSSFTF